MKKKNMLNAWICLFSILMLTNPIRLNGAELIDAPAIEVTDDILEQNSEENSDENNDNEGISNSQENNRNEELYFVANERDIFSFDYENASDEELDAYLTCCEDMDVAIWLFSLDEKQKEELKKRDICLNQTLDYYGDGCEECGYTWGSHFDTAMEYYERLYECKGKNPSVCANYYFASASGYIEIAFTEPQKGTEVSKIKVSNIDTTKQTTYRQDSISCSVINSKYGLALVIPEDKNWHTWSASSSLEAAQNDVNKCVANGPHSINYFDFIPEVYFKKPVGYALSAPVYTNYASSLHTFYTAFEKKPYTYNGSSRSGICYLHDSLKGDSDYSSEKEIHFRASANLPHHYGIGARNETEITSAVGNYERATFTLTPAKYEMAFQVNGGSGSVPSQTCVFGNSYSYPAGPISPNYTVTFNGNGGLANQASATVTRSFMGWSTNSNATSGATGTYLASNSKNGTVVTNYAIWGGANNQVILPSASKRYTVIYNANGGAASQTSSVVNASMLGWGTTSSSGVNIGVSGASYRPTGDVTLYAQYKNASVTLPMAVRNGYILTGWYNQSQGGTRVNHAGGNYQPSDNVTLYAQWNPIQYRIELNANGGRLIEENMQMNAKYDQTVRLPLPKRTGYAFKGWSSENAMYQAEEVKNLTESDGDCVTLQAMWEPQNVNYTIRKLFKGAKDTGYKVDPKKTETHTALADSQIVVIAPKENGYLTPASRRVNISADGSTVIDFYYEYNVVGQNSEGSTSTDLLNTILLRLKEIRSVSELTQKDWENMSLLITAALDTNTTMANQLERIIRDSRLMTDDEKLKILEEIANGYLTDNFREKLIESIQKSSLSSEEKNNLIGKIRSLSNLSLSQQQKIKELLENGSSVSYQIGGVTYEIRKNADGTLSILLKGLNGEKKITTIDAVTVAGKTYAVTEIAKGAFKDNATLQEITITNNITKIGDEAFIRCKNLKIVTVGSGVKVIGNRAFENCPKLTKVVLNEGLMQIGKRAFYKCKSIQAVKIPKTVLIIKAYGFAKCSRLKKITFATKSELVSLGNGAFSDCVVLEKIMLPKRLSVIAAKTFLNDKKLQKCQGGEGITTIGESAFQSCRKLTSFTVKSKVQNIQKKAFYKCTSLKTVTIKSKNLIKVGSEAFMKCSKGIKYKVPTDKKTEYAKLFQGKYE